MEFKSYRVYFARTAVGEDADPLGPSLTAAVAQHGENLPAIELADERFQMRDLERVGAVWKGSFVKLRDDAPHVVAADDEEHLLELEDGDRIIEKCYFLFYERQNLIVWQANRAAGGLSRAEAYLSRCLETFVALPQVMNEAELMRVLRGQLYEVDFTYARPAGPPDGAPRWNQNAFDMMANVAAAHAKFTLRAPRGGSLARAARDMVRQLVRAPGAEKVRVRLTDETDPIDLFMAPLKDRIRVMMLGRYPVAQSVFEELEAAHERQRHALQ